MSVRVVFECGGCDAVAEGTRALRKRFQSISGRDYGFGGPIWDVGVEDVVPEGWIAFDPYTYCCYCPNCWESIQGENNEQAERERMEHEMAGSRCSPACGWCGRCS